MSDVPIRLYSGLDIMDYIRKELEMTNKHILWIAVGSGFLLGMYVGKR